MKENLRVSEVIRGNEVDREPKASFYVSGFVIGPVPISPTKETMRWCRLAYDDHASGCPSCGSRRLGCPGHPQSIFFNRVFDHDAYLIGVNADFGAYLVSRLREKSKNQQVIGSKELKNKRWYQGTLVRFLKDWYQAVAKEFPELNEGGYHRYIENGESIGVDFGQVCRSAGLPLMRLNLPVSDYRVMQASFSRSPEIAMADLPEDGPMVVENYFMAPAEQIIDYFESGGYLPMSRLALIARPRGGE